MGVLCIVASSCLAQTFTDQDRFGKTANEILWMGREGWVQWYNDPTRAGADGSIQAEKIYCRALMDRNGILIKKKSKDSQEFFRYWWLQLSHTAKGAMAVLDTRHRNWDGLSLVAAEIATDVNIAMYEMMSDPYTQRPLLNEMAIFEHYEKGKSVLENASEVAKTEYGRLGYSIKEIFRAFSDHPYHERAAVRQFAMRMITVACQSPK